MPIYDMYPYTNLHELNLDWIIKVAKETQDTLTDITTMVSDLSDLSDCLHAYPNFSPNPRLQCDYDLAVSGDIRASSHSVICGGVVATGTVTAGTLDGPLSCGNVGSTTLPVYMDDGIPTVCSTTLGVSITGNAATATTAGSATTAAKALEADKLRTSKTFTLTGAVSGTATSDLETGVSIATTQNIIKKISAQVMTASEIGISGQTGVKAVSIDGTDIDWEDPTFDPDTKILLECEMAMGGSIVAVGHNWLSAHGLALAVIGDQGFDIDDFTDGIIDLYYIDPIS